MNTGITQVAFRIRPILTCCMAIVLSATAAFAQGVRNVGTAPTVGSLEVLGAGRLERASSVSAARFSGLGRVHSNLLSPGIGATGSYSGGNVGGLLNSYRVSDNAEIGGAGLQTRRYYGSRTNGIVPGKYYNVTLTHGRLIGEAGAPSLTRRFPPTGQAISAQPFMSQMQPAVDRFDMDEALRSSNQLRDARQALIAGEYDRATELSRVGLVFSPNRPEGEWLLALAEAARGRNGEAVYHLRNAMMLYPEVLNESRDSASLLGAEKVKALIEAGQSAGGDQAPSSEQKLVAAWLALDSGRLDEADSLLETVDQAVGCTLDVFYAIDWSIIKHRQPAQTAEPAATEGQPAPAAEPSVAPGPDATQAGAPAPAAAQTAPLGPPPATTAAWLKQAGPLLGVPPEKAMHWRGRLDTRK